MIRKYIIPLVAVAGVLFAIWTALQSAKPVAPAKPIAEPARSPYLHQDFRVRHRRG